MKFLRHFPLRGHVLSAAFLLLACALPVQAKLLQLANVRDYGALCDGSHDDTAAFNRAIHAARQVLIPAGDCVVRNILLHNDTELFGVGDESVLYVPADAPWGISANPINGGTANPANNMRGLYLHDFQLRGANEAAGFAEQRHLLNLNAVSGVRIENMLFTAFRGDAIYLGSSNTPRVERHNRDIVIRDSRFDGINKANRNAISAIDVDGLLIENNSFRNTTRSDMPGAIDLEPNQNAFHIIRNVTIRNNSFNNIGGSNGAIAIYVPAQVEAEPNNIVITGNRFQGLSASGVLLWRKRAPTADTPMQQILIADNVFSQCSRPFSLFGANGVSIVDNRFEDCFGAAMLGYTKNDTAVREVLLENNSFINSANNDSVCLFVFIAEHIDISGNLWQDCARSGPRGYALAFNVGKSSHIRVTGNQFRAPGKRISHAAQVDPRHRLDAASNIWLDNQLDDGLLVEFKAASPTR